MGNLNTGLFTSNDQTWETPLYLFNILDSAFHFNIDLCALPFNAKVSNFFSPEDDGLSQNWIGTCWLNPPYGRYQKDWIIKASNEYINNNSTIVCLIPARPDTKLWHDIIYKNAKVICYLQGRVKFGNSNNSAPFPSAIVVFSRYVSLYQLQVLHSLGHVEYPTNLQSNSFISV